MSGAEVVERTASARPGAQAMARAWPWLLYALVLATAPLVFRSGGSIALLCQMGSAIVFGLAYNMLLGQGGMLSFGHAVYYGLGCFFTMHAMNLAAKGAVWLPLPLLPLVGALAGLAFGIALGFVTTRRAGTSFAMITFGVGELVAISASMFPAFFGGEVGLTGTRVYGQPWLGLSFGPSIQVYGLIAVWVFIATVAMYAFTGTPLGRLANAVRDNPERVAFIGYNAQWIRFLTLALSGMFSGIAGALAAINFESATLESLGAAQSGSVLLFTFIGGTGLFSGPIVGAVVGTLMTVLVSGVTKAWPLYLGLFFVLVVKFAPTGILGLLADAWRYARSGALARHAPVVAATVLGWLACAAGAVVFIEMTYHRTVIAASDPVMKLAGMSLDTASAAPWVASLSVALLAGAVAWRVSRPLREEEAPPPVPAAAAVSNAGTDGAAA